MDNFALLRRLFQEEPYSGKISERRHSEKLPEEPSSGKRRRDSGRTPEYVPKGRVPEFSRKKGLSKDHLLLLEEGSSGSYFVCFF